LYQYRDFASHGASLAFTPDGTILAFRGPRQQVQLFEASTGREHKALRREGGGGLLGFGISPDGKALVSLEATSSAAGRKPRLTVVFWELTTNQPTATTTLSLDVGHLNSIAFSHGGKTLATTCEDGV